ncbi:MAG TPA: dihydrofolate reductase family protein [Ktedonobacterales bacterium]
MRVLLLAAITLDGKIARRDDEFTGWSSTEDKRLLARTTRDAGVIVMGSRTFATLPRPLPDRLNVVLTRTPPASAPEGVLYLTGEPGAVLAALEARGFTTVVVSGGAHVFHAFIEAGLVDELWLTLTPHLFGAGISLVGDTPLEAQFELLEARPLGPGELHLRYGPHREATP